MDPIADLITKEELRQAETLMLIPSENYASRAVREAVGSALGNKYAEGYPGKRYYRGNQIIDQIEQITIDRAKSLFNVPAVNVQAYSGSPANAAILLAVAESGETIMGMKLSAGGHLTHGHPGITFSGKFFNSVQYETGADGMIDYDDLEARVRENKPRILIAGTTAYPRELNWSRFGAIADAVGAYLLADISHLAGLIAAGVIASPINHAHIVMTTTHKTLRGPRGAIIMTTEKGLKKDKELARKIDKAVFPGLQGGPHMNVIAGIGIALAEASSDKFKAYARQVLTNAKVLANNLQEGGVTLAGGGTDNHLILADLRPLNLEGKTVSAELEEAGIIVNANAVPHDEQPPLSPSGIRLGTPAITTRGMKEEEMKLIGNWILEVIKGSSRQVIAKQVKALTNKFPVP